MNDQPLNIRNLPGAEVLDHVNCAYIARQFFSRTRSWFTQRLNNNAVNGKLVAFTATELATLRLALTSLADDLRAFSSNLNTTAMPIQVYVIKDPEAIDFLIADDLDGFRQHLAEQEFPAISEPETFATVQQAQAFCAGLARGHSDLSPTIFPLRSYEPTDQPYITALNNF
ncbi:MAG: DUF5053 domain-containing protein [Muribaculaceae bacterium]